ncbi:hypothetical protein Q0601_12620 [Paracoccus onubensis]|uniref:hypothetical protein n=1 Tax=Paracoccus onubensis TaxID=1675788 RepID=UPI00272F260F|nr:hypothetical protein [Paracoccus onubensis]MDP0928021.1 hypothetical protein [Paracoccus onubensis]
MRKAQCLRNGIVAGIPAAEGFMSRKSPDKLTAGAVPLPGSGRDYSEQLFLLTDHEN